jgi:phage terminase large subunit GpA-like protein
MLDYGHTLSSILDNSRVQISTIRPSEFAEQKVMLGGAFPGLVSYYLTPYTREIIDRLSPEDPARDIAVMGSAQFGKTASIILPGLAYLIKNAPGNIIMTVGHEKLLQTAMSKLDGMIDASSLRSLIRSSAQRSRNTKSGDTDKMKEFLGGYLKLDHASSSDIWRQEDYKYGFLDDYEALKGITKDGSLRELIMKRFTAYANTRKIFYISSPANKTGSNIYEVYKLGDQRKFMVPCPCCGTFIELRWSIKNRDGDICGMTWELDDEDRLIPDSVGYRCQECYNIFTDSGKSEYVNKGYWEPTAKPYKPSFFSYHMSSLYSPHGMTGWTDYVYQFLEANPPMQPRNEGKHQTFVNLNLGWPYEGATEAPKASDLQNNTRSYPHGVIPEALSIRDGNGRIVLLTIACDLNGVVDDARLDYEIVAWSENESSYSVTHGSIGTFIPRENTLKNKQDRERWTYEHNRPNSVWPELTKIMTAWYPTDKGKRRRIAIGGIDVGHYDDYAYRFIDKNPPILLVGLKGEKEHSFVKLGRDVPNFKLGTRPGLHMVQVNQVKDHIAEQMRLRWNPGTDDTQPIGFMNYPEPSDGKYLYKNFFSHYESEHRIAQLKDGNVLASMWQKKTSVSQNHFWDVRVYNFVLKDIIVHILAKFFKRKDYTWSDFVLWITASKK